MENIETLIMTERRAARAETLLYVLGAIAHGDKYGLGTKEAAEIAATMMGFEYPEKEEENARNIRSFSGSVEG